MNVPKFAGISLHERATRIHRVVEVGRGTYHNKQFVRWGCGNVAWEKNLSYNKAGFALFDEINEVEVDVDINNYKFCRACFHKYEALQARVAGVLA